MQWFRCFELQNGHDVPSAPSLGPTRNNVVHTCFKHKNGEQADLKAETLLAPSKVLHPSILKKRRTQISETRLVRTSLEASCRRADLTSRIFF